MHPYLLELGDTDAWGEDLDDDDDDPESPAAMACAALRARAAEEAAADVVEWLPRLDALVIGPGLGGAPSVHFTPQVNNAPQLVAFFVSFRLPPVKCARIFTSVMNEAPLESSGEYVVCVCQ